MSEKIFIRSLRTMIAKTRFGPSEYWLVNDTQGRTFTAWKNQWSAGWMGGSEIEADIVTDQQGRSKLLEPESSKSSRPMGSSPSSHAGSMDGSQAQIASLLSSILAELTRLRMVAEELADQSIHKDLRTRANS